MSSTSVGTTIEAYLTPGAFGPDTELINGEVVVIDGTFEHQRITGLVYIALELWTRAASGRGRAGFGGNWSIATDSVVKPDVWWSAEGATPGGIRSDRPPALAVEIRSPGTWAYDIGPKRAIYEAAGVSELWLVDPPSRVVLVNRRSTPTSSTFDVTLDATTDKPLTTPLLDGFTLDLEQLFA